MKEETLRSASRRLSMRSALYYIRTYVEKFEADRGLVKWETNDAENVLLSVLS